MLKKCLVGLLLLVVLAVVGMFGFIQYQKSPPLFEPSVVGLYQTQRPAIDDASLRTIESGQIVGTRDAFNTNAWVGIPYAAPPLGANRWRAPQAVLAWQGVREAVEYGQPCTQYFGLLAGVEGKDGQVVGSEDCLTLNVWAPVQTQEQNEQYPVMVWIHGGSNDSGTANMYQGHHLAGSQKVVVVGVNYRLGILGWMSHPAIRATSANAEDASGNYGTLDLIASLKWVQNNISAFGGDPNNVTIFGESAGGRNVFSLMASPLAKGLFHKAIAQSGTTDTTKLVLAEDFADKKLTALESGLINSSNEMLSQVLRNEYPEESVEQIRDRITSTSPAALMELWRSYTAEDLMMLASDHYGRSGYLEIANVLRDGYVLPEQSTQSLFANPASYNSVPLMVGTTRDENKLFMFRNEEHVSIRFGFIPVINNPDRYNRVAKIVSDNWKAGAVDEPAIAISKTTAPPVYAYRFDWDDYPPNPFADLAQLLGAAHGFEINFVFGDFIGGTPTDVIEGRSNLDSRRDLSLKMMDYWAEFAYSGNPNKGRSSEQVEWTAWSDQGDNLLRFDESSDGGVQMTEIRTDFDHIKTMLKNDKILRSTEEKCDGYANLFMHGYQTDDFFDPQEYSDWGCDEYPVGMFRSK